MDSANFINFIKNPGSLHQLTFQELNSLIEAYPYCQNLHFMAMMKAKVEQHKGFDKKLSLAATYFADRQYLYKQIQDPIKPESTSDNSHYGAAEMSPVASDPVDELLRSSIVAVPPTPVIPDDDPEIPEEIPHTQSETHAPEYISDEILDPDIKIVEDKSGSQLIIKNADMPLDPEDEKRKVIYLEDLFTEKEKVEEIPEVEAEKTMSEIPVESEAPVMEPVAEDIDESDLPLEDDDIFSVESEPVSDHDMGIPISDAGTISDQSEFQDLPQENQEEAGPGSANPGFDSIEEESAVENELIEIPNHIIDEIPFEVTNLSEDLPDEGQPVDYDYEEDAGFIEEEATSEEGSGTFSEQSIGIAVRENKLRMEIEEEENTDKAEESPEEETNETEDDAHDSEDVEELAPLPKVAFKSWPGMFKPQIPREEEAKDLPIKEEEEKEEVVDIPEIIKTQKRQEIVVEEEINEGPEEKRSIDLTEVIKEHKKKKKKEKAKAQKKKKAKKEKTREREIEDIEEESPVKAKKKKKGKGKKKKKKNIKELAQKSLTLSDDIISETLAELLVDQGSNKKAIKMYKKLSLIFPEKSAFFASQIKKLKK